MPDGEQGDLVVEIDELLDDYPRTVAAHIVAGVIPRGFQIGSAIDF